MEVGPVDDLFEREAESIAQRIAEPPEDAPARMTLVDASDVRLAEEEEEEEESGDAETSTESAPASRIDENAAVQRLPASRLRLQRKVEIRVPSPVIENPTTIIKRSGVVSDAPLGLTQLVINGVDAGPNVSLGSLLNVPKIFVDTDAQNKVVRCHLEGTINLSLAHKVRILSPPPTKEGWKDTLTVEEVRALRGVASQVCRNRRKTSTVNMIVKGDPSSDKLVKKVAAAEAEHVAENTAAFERHLVPLHDRIAKLAAIDTTTPCKVQGKVSICTQQDCSNELQKQLNLPATLLAFKTEYEDAIKKHDGDGGDHHSRAERTLDPSCNNLTIKIDVR
ncbi:MAG: hypothetical protein ACRENP_04890 [Longimicrobiales bacterium]